MKAHSKMERMLETFGIFMDITRHLKYRLTTSYVAINNSYYGSKKKYNQDEISDHTD